MRTLNHASMPSVVGDGVTSTASGSGAQLQLAVRETSATNPWGSTTSHPATDIQRYVFLASVHRAQCIRSRLSPSMARGAKMHYTLGYDFLLISVPSVSRFWSIDGKAFFSHCLHALVVRELCRSHPVAHRLPYARVCIGGDRFKRQLKTCTIARRSSVDSCWEEVLSLLRITSLMHCRLRIHQMSSNPNLADVTAVSRLAPAKILRSGRGSAARSSPS